jgi:hypothetical protein
MRTEREDVSGQHEAQELSGPQNRGERRGPYWQAVLDLVPNSRFISGASASDVGISATVVKDEFSGQWSLRVGGLPFLRDEIVMLFVFECYIY